MKAGVWSRPIQGPSSRFRDPYPHSRLGAAIWPWLSVIETEAVLETKLKIKLANVLKIKNKFTDKLHLPDTQLLRGPKGRGGPLTYGLRPACGCVELVCSAGVLRLFRFPHDSSCACLCMPCICIWTPASVSAREVLQFDVFYASSYSMKST